MWGAIDGAVNAAALVVGAKDPFNMTEAELAAVRQLLVKQRGLLRFYWDDPAAEQALASGEIVAAYTWNQSLVNLQNQGLPVRYMRPKKGILTWVCGLVAGKEAPADEQLVCDFLDAMVDPQTGNVLFNNYGYGHSNRATFDTVAKDKLAAYGLPDNPAEMFKGSIVLHAMDPKVRETYTKMLEEVRAGASQAACAGRAAPATPAARRGEGFSLGLAARPASRLRWSWRLTTRGQNHGRY